LARPFKFSRSMPRQLIWRNAGPARNSSLIFFVCVRAADRQGRRVSCATRERACSSAPRAAIFLQTGWLRFFHQ
jgi:hypothetical protein